MPNILSQFTSSLSHIAIDTAIITIILSVILGIVISLTYKKTTDISDYSENFFTTLILSPAIIAVIIMLIGSNVARAFSLAGAFSIIRFRSAPGNPKDITYVLFAMAAGLACGTGSYIYAVLFTVVLCVIMLILYTLRLGAVKQNQYTLKITIPENLNFNGIFDDILSNYTKAYQLNKIKTADMGSVFELTYSISVATNTDIKEFLDDIRCRNGNLTVLLSLAGNDKEF